VNAAIETWHKAKFMALKFSAECDHQTLKWQDSSNAFPQK